MCCVGVVSMIWECFFPIVLPGGAFFILFSVSSGVLNLSVVFCTRCAGFFNKIHLTLFQKNNLITPFIILLPINVKTTHF